MRQKRNKKAVLLVLCLILGMILTGCGSGKRQHPAAAETPLARLGEDTISLEEAVFYTRMMQEQWEYTYYEDYGENLWQTQVNEETGTLGDALKRDVLDALTEIHLLCSHAKEYGMELSRNEQETIAKRARTFMEQNTPSVLEAAGATESRVADFLMRNQLAARVAEAMQAAYEPEVDEESARVGKLTYALFATTGIFDAQGNQTPFTEEELIQVKKNAEAFEARAKELGDISAAGEEVSHTVIDVYFNDVTDGGAHELVAEAARQLEVGGISGLVETEEGYYVVQRISEYEEEATLENIGYQKEQARRAWKEQQLSAWQEEAPLVLDEELWNTVQVKEMLTEASAQE